MAADGSTILYVMREVAEELGNRLRARLAEQPRLTTALSVLATVICLVIIARLVFWLFFSSPAIPLGLVRGSVTLNGQPLARATVEFTPQKGGPSYGKTDTRGFYELAYLPGKEGAMVGEHIVRITTYDWITLNNGSKSELPEQVPARYNAESELRASVSPGSQKIDWELSGSVTPPDKAIPRL